MTSHDPLLRRSTRGVGIALSLCAAAACGGDDETTAPPVKCVVEIQLTGGYEVNASGTSCNGGAQYGADHLGLILDVPGRHASVLLRLFGGQVGTGASGMTVDAGVQLNLEGKPTWEAGITDGSACRAVVEDDVADVPGDEGGVRVLKARVESCSQALAPLEAGADPVTVVRLRGAARYIPGQ